ncbi:hypothetical protein GC093_24555 [Paenibacillus sp. LMG 31456]|uniref:Fibronectin type-III domain-containing protein n=1 Tax=Paenibacillus foliorum TaxID=2654974 RepID=A0A972GYX5_9BACL|nr:stalk domain-containing protein [Paenibacillus foliorum]NOU96362.1 hypothetical protein [Paenibacillus foliorum]
MRFVKLRSTIVYVMLLSMLFSAFGFVSTPSVHAASTVGVGDLLITELVPYSKESGGALYRYLQLYNNTDQPIDLSKQKIYYYYQVKADPWKSSAINAFDITDRDKKVTGPDGQTKPKMYIPPYSTKIVWISRSNPTATLDQFNTTYNTTLTDDDVVYVFQDSGPPSTTQRYYGVIGQGLENKYDQDKDRYAFVRYNVQAGTGSCSGSTCDVAAGKSIKYFYPKNGLDPINREMEIRESGSRLQTPTPGKLVAGQTPPKKLTGLNATLGLGRISLTWASSTDPNVVNYRIYESGQAIAETQENSIDLSDSPSFRMEDGETYSFSVAAINTDGVESTQTAHVSILFEGGPSGVRAEVGDRSIQLSWQPTTKPVLGYKVYLNDQPVTSSVYTVTYSTYTYNLTGLTNGQNYKLNVSAVRQGTEPGTTLETALSADAFATPSVITGLSLSGIPSTLAVGSLYNLKVTTTNIGSEPSEVTNNAMLTVSDPTIVSIAGAAVRPLMAGQTRITGTYSGFSAFIDVTVIPPVTLSSLTIQGYPDDKVMSQGTLQLQVIGNYSDQSTQDLTGSAQYSSSVTSTATVDNGGLVTALRTGDTLITAKYGGKTANVNLTVAYSRVNSSRGSGGRSAVASAAITGNLLITEAVIQSADDKEESGELYRYIELYNNTDQPIDLSQQKIYYYYQVKDQPWKDSSFDKLVITDRDKNVMGQDEKVKPKMYIQPHSTKIIWVYVPKDVTANKTVAQFNAQYGTQLTDEDILYVFHNGFSYTGQRYLAVVSPGGDKDTDRYSFIRYNAGAGAKSCNETPGSCDFIKGESINYFYPQNGLDPVSRELEIRDADSRHQKPTPGQLAANQVPDGTVTATTVVDKKDSSESIVLQIENRMASIRGKELYMEVAPVLDGDTTIVPYRFIGEALGAIVGWEQDTQKVTLTLNNKSVVLFINNKEAIVDGKKVTLELAPKIIDGNTMVPLRFVSEGLDQEVKYDVTNKSITLLPIKK